MDRNGNYPVVGNRPDKERQILHFLTSEKSRFKYVSVCGHRKEKGTQTRKRDLGVKEWCNICDRKSERGLCGRGRGIAKGEYHGANG